MDELAVAAAVEAMSVDDASKENQAPDVTVGTVDAAEALQVIDGNTGEPRIGRWRRPKRRFCGA